MSEHVCSDHRGEGPSVFDLPIPGELKQQWKALETRRHFLGRGGKTLGWAALASLLGESLFGESSAHADAVPGVLGNTHFRPTAKRVIYLFMSGAPPHMDLLDYKPGLGKWFDKDLPESVRGKSTPTGMTAGQSRFPVAPPHWGFKQHGRSGRWFSELLPCTGKLADEHGRRAFDVHRRHQPRAGDPYDEHRQHHARQAVDGRMAGLWSWQHEREPAGVRRAQFEVHDRQPAADQFAALGQRLLVVAVCRRDAPFRRRPGALPQ